MAQNESEEEQEGDDEHKIKADSLWFIQIFRILGGILAELVIDLPSRTQICEMLKNAWQMSEQEFTGVLEALVFNFGELFMWVQLVQSEEKDSLQYLMELLGINDSRSSKQICNQTYINFKYTIYDRDFYALQCLSYLLPGGRFMLQLAKAFQIESLWQSQSLADKPLDQNSGRGSSSLLGFYELILMLQIDETPMINVVSRHLDQEMESPYIQNEIRTCLLQEFFLHPSMEYEKLRAELRENRIGRIVSINKQLLEISTQSQEKQQFQLKEAYAQQNLYEPYFYYTNKEKFNDMYTSLQERSKKSSQFDVIFGNLEEHRKSKLLEITSKITDTPRLENLLKSTLAAEAQHVNDVKHQKMIKVNLKLIHLILLRTKSPLLQQLFSPGYKDIWDKLG